jgi:hypothetical protein
MHAGRLPQIISGPKAAILHVPTLGSKVPLLQVPCDCRRDFRGADPDDGLIGDDPFEPVRHRECHRAARPHAVTDKDVREPVGGAGDVPVGQLSIVDAHRGAGAEPFERALEQRAEGEAAVSSHCSAVRL